MKGHFEDTSVQGIAAIKCRTERQLSQPQVNPSFCALLFFFFFFLSHSLHHHHGGYNFGEVEKYGILKLAAD